MKRCAWRGARAGGWRRWPGSLMVAWGTLSAWVKQAELDAGLRSDGLVMAEREELRRLRREVRILREEREILKPPREVADFTGPPAEAAAFFARKDRPSRRGVWPGRRVSPAGTTRGEAAGRVGGGRKRRRCWSGSGAVVVEVRFRKIGCGPTTAPRLAQRRERSSIRPVSPCGAAVACPGQRIDNSHFAALPLVRSLPRRD